MSRKHIALTVVDNNRANLGPQLIERPAHIVVTPVRHQDHEWASTIRGGHRSPNRRRPASPRTFGQARASTLGRAASAQRARV